MFRTAKREALHPNFRKAVFASDRTGTELARLSGFTQLTHFSALLHAGRRGVRTTPLIRSRLHKVPALIGYTGEVFRG